MSRKLFKNINLLSTKSLAPNKSVPPASNNARAPKESRPRIHDRESARNDENNKKTHSVTSLIHTYNYIGQRKLHNLNVIRMFNSTNILV